MSSRDHRREPDAEVSFEGIVDLGSMPPPASGSGHIDVHRAPTAVSTMTDELMEEINRARQEVKARETEQTRVLPKFRMPDDAVPGFTDETPTRPGKDGKAMRRPEAPDLLVTDPAESGVTFSVATAAEVAEVMQVMEATQAMPAAPVRPPLPPVSFAETIPSVTLEPRPIHVSRRAAWPRILFFVITLAALFVTALALRRYRSSVLRGGR